MIPTHVMAEAERTRTGAEQRRADLCMSELAAALSSLISGVARPGRALARGVSRRRAAELQVGCPGGRPGEAVPACPEYASAGGVGR